VYQIPDFLNFLDLTFLQGETCGGDVREHDLIVKDWMTQMVKSPSSNTLYNLQPTSISLLSYCSWYIAVGRTSYNAFDEGDPYLTVLALSNLISHETQAHEATKGMTNKFQRTMVCGDIFRVLC
jgi:hypothetical protein